MEEQRHVTLFTNPHYSYLTLRFLRNQPVRIQKGGWPLSIISLFRHLSHSGGSWRTICSRRYGTEYVINFTNHCMPPAPLPYPASLIREAN